MSDVLELGMQRVLELGLKEVDGGFYYADDIHKLLGEAHFMSCQQNEYNLWRALEPREIQTYPKDTHQALLIGIKPIVQDTAESLLRELIATESNCDGVQRLAERARALLEKP